MSELQETVENLIAEACSHPPGSLKRQTHLTQIIRLISNQLWRDQAPYYQDALQQTWVYFCRNLCEATTGFAYDPDKANVVRSEEHTSELQSPCNLVCRLLLEKKKRKYL